MSYPHLAKTCPLSRKAWNGELGVSSGEPKVTEDEASLISLPR